MKIRIDDKIVDFEEHRSDIHRLNKVIFCMSMMLVFMGLNLIFNTKTLGFEAIFGGIVILSGILGFLYVFLALDIKYEKMVRKSSRSIELIFVLKKGFRKYRKGAILNISFEEEIDGPIADLDSGTFLIPISLRDTFHEIE